MNEKGRLMSIVIPALAFELTEKVRETVDRVWGPTQEATIFYAQIHQESGWDPKARSAHALGLAQFTPETAKWIAERYPSELGACDPFDAEWAIRACVRYDKFLFDRVHEADGEDKWCFTLSGYNGGLGWVSRDMRLARENGADPRLWWENVELYSTRADWAIKENRGYVKRILKVLVPVYQDGGFL
jgi:soluble lytic murein transglycosylase-like protein